MSYLDQYRDHNISNKVQYYLGLYIYGDVVDIIIKYIGEIENRIHVTYEYYNHFAFQYSLYVIDCCFINDQLCILHSDYDNYYGLFNTKLNKFVLELTIDKCECLGIIANKNYVLIFFTSMIILYNHNNNTHERINDICSEYKSYCKNLCYRRYRHKVSLIGNDIYIFVKEYCDTIIVLDLRKIISTKAVSYVTTVIVPQIIKYKKQMQEQETVYKMQHIIRKGCYSYESLMKSRSFDCNGMVLFDGYECVVFNLIIGSY